jgi:hypothetical protein
MDSYIGNSSDRFFGLIARKTTRKLLTAFALGSGAAALAAAPATVFAQDAGYSCSDRSGGGANVIQARLTDVRFAHHDGYDRIVFEFANAPKLPSYKLTQQGPTFITDPKGERRTLEGTAGLRTLFFSTDWTNGVPLNDAKPELPVIREVANVGNFEGYTSYGTGLSSRACFRTLELTAPTRLVIDFQAPRDQPASSASSSGNIAAAASSDPSAASDPSALAADPGALAQTGHPAVKHAAPASDYRGLVLAALGALLVVLGGVRLATLGMRQVTLKTRR